MSDFTDIFLDTNIMLDVIENRNKEVKQFFTQLIKRHKNGDIQLSTSIFNITELLDKEFEISYFQECMKEKISGDVIIRRRGARVFYCERSIRNKDKIIERVNAFLENSEIHIHSSTLPIEEREMLYKLLGDRGIRSQDAIIISCALHNESDYFFTSDGNLKNALPDIIYTF
ncbi:PIN domain-containing protein, partial [bacterium]|nr:PIN domain-containing protein [bacterium]